MPFFILLNRSAQQHCDVLRVRRHLQFQLADAAVLSVVFLVSNGLSHNFWCLCEQAHELQAGATHSSLHVQLLAGINVHS